MVGGQGCHGKVSLDLGNGGEVIIGPWVGIEEIRLGPGYQRGFSGIRGCQGVHEGVLGIVRG